MGLAGYYKRFVRDFSKIAMWITALTWKDVRFDWTEQCESVFRTLKERLTTTPILVLPEEDKELTFYTDVSGVGLGAVLMQK